MDDAFSFPEPDFTFVAEIDDGGVTEARGGWHICGAGRIGLPAAGGDICAGSATSGSGGGTRFAAY
jgi:hypothetical protein